MKICILGQFIIINIDFKKILLSNFGEYEIILFVKDMNRCALQQILSKNCFYREFQKF